MTGHRHNFMGQNHSQHVGYNRTHMAHERNPCRSLIGKSSSHTQTGNRPSKHIKHKIGDRFLTTYQDAHRMSQCNSAPLHTDVSASRNDSFSAPNNLDRHRVSFDTFAPVRDTAVSRLAVCTERSSPLTPVSNPGSFVGSLRMYPSPQLEHSTSADLIHKLLAYTHTVNISKSSHHSKSLRCLKNTDEQQNIPEITKKASKNVQTYTRNHYDIPNYSQKTELEDKDTKRIIEESGSGCSRSKEDDYNYDYLKPYCVARFDTATGYGHNGTPGTSPTGSRSKHSTLNMDPPRTSKSRTDTTRVANMSNKSVRRSQYTSDRSPKASSSRTEKISLRSSPNRSDLTSPNRRGKDDPPGLMLDRNSRTSQIRTEGAKMYIHADGSSKNPYRFEGSPRNSPPRWNRPEVRYLNDISKYVRDALRQVYEDQPQTCPRMSSRYSQHRREFHRNGPAAGADWASIDIQTSPRQSHVTSHTCPNSPITSPKTSPIRKSCLICHKPSPCGCSKSRKIKFRSPNVCNTRNECDSEEGIADRDYVNRKIEDVIFDWLQDIPVCASYSSGDKCQREIITHSLIDGIIRCYGSDNFERIAKDEILSCLTQLPMWYPNKNNKNEFRNEQADKLIRKLRNVKSKRDKFGESIAKWFKELTFKTTHDGKSVNKRAILKDITQQLRRVALKKYATMENYYDCLKEKSHEIIKKLPIEVESNRMLVNKKLNDRLMDRLALIPVRDIKKKLDYDPENEFEWEVLDYVEDLPEFADLSETEGRNVLKKLAKKLKYLRDQNLTYDEVRDEMETAINEWVVFLRERLPLELENEFQKDVLTWIEEIPAIAFENPEEKSANEASAKVLAETLNRLQKEGFDIDVIQDTMVAAIKDVLASCLQRKGKCMDIKTKHRLAELLLDKLSNTVEKEKRKRQVQRLVKKKTQKWLHELSDLTLTPEKRQEIDGLAQILANDINEMLKNGINDNTHNEISEKIQVIYESALSKIGVTFTPKQKKNISNILLKKILYLLKSIEDPIPNKEIEDVLQKLMVDLLEDSYFLDTTNEPDEKELRIMANEIAKNFAGKASEGIYDEHVHQEMLEEITFHLDRALEKTHPDMFIKDNVKNEMAEKFLVTILVSINKAEKKHKLSEKYKQVIMYFLENVDDLNKTCADKIENEKVTRALTNKIVDLQAQDLDHELITDKIKKEIENSMQLTLEKRGVHISSKIAKKYVDNLLKPLITETKNVDKPQIATKEMINELEKEICYFIEDMPQWTSDTPEHKYANSIVSKCLAKNINLLQYEGIDKDDIRDAILKEIKSHLDLGAEQRKQNVIDPRDKDVLSENLLDNIITKVDQLQRKQNLPDVMWKEICKWMESISTFESINPAEKSLDKKAARILTNQVIKYLQKNDIIYDSQDQINTQIKGFIESVLSKKGECLNTKTKQKLTKDLLSKISLTFKHYRKSQIPTNKMVTRVQNVISEWIPQNLKETAKDKKEAENMVHRMGKNIIDLFTQGIHNDDVQQKIIDFIKDEIDTAYENKGEQINFLEKNNLVEKLFDEVVITADKIDKKANLLDIIIRDVLSWVEEIPELESSYVLENNETEQWARSLSKNLQSFKRNSLDEKSEQNQTIKEIKMNLDLILEKMGQQINPSRKNMLCEKLAKKIIKQKQRAKTNSIPTKAIENGFKEDIETCILYEIPVLIAGKQREKFVENLANGLNQIYAEGMEDENFQKRMLDKVENDLEEMLVKDGGEMSQHERHELSKNLVSSLCLTGDTMSKKQNLTHDLTKIVSDWIKDIPELVSVKPSYKRDNQEMSHKLAKTMEGLHTNGVDEENLRDIMMKEIKTELNSSLAKKGESMSLTTKNKMVEKLFVDMSKTVDRSESIDVSPDKLQKAFRSEIAEWVHDIPELASTTTSGIQQNEEFSDKLSQKLAQYQKSDLNQKYKEEMLEEIKNELDSVLTEKSEMVNTNLKNRLAEKLLTNLIGTAHFETEKLETRYVDNKVKHDVRNWIENIPELDPDSNENKQVLSKNINDTIKKYSQADLDDLQVRENAIIELKSHLDTSLGKKKIDEKMKTTLADLLLDQTSETVRKYEKLRVLNNLWYKNIVQWFESIPESKSMSPTEEKQVENVSRALTMALNALQSKGIEHREIRCEMLGEIKLHLEHLLDNKGNQIDTVRKTMLCEEIVDKLIQDAKQAKIKKLPASLDEFSQNELKNELIEWMLQNSDLPFDKSDLKDLELITEKLVAKMNKMYSDGVSLGIIKTKIINDIIKELGALCEGKGKQIDTKTKQKIAENMFDTMIRSIKNKQRASKVGAINLRAELQDTPTNITKYVLNNPDLPFDNADIENIDNMSKNLAEKMNELKKQGYSDEQIQEIMMNEMENELNEVCKAKGVTLDPKIENNLKRELLNNMEKSANDIREYKLEPQSYEQNILKLQEKTSNGNDEVAPTLALKYQELEDLGLTKEEIQKQMVQGINTHVTEEGAKLSEEDKNKSRNNLSYMLENDVNNKILSNLMDDIPNLKSKTPQQKKENEEIAKKLANKYQELKDLGFTEDKIQNEMAKELDKLSTSRGTHLNEKDKNKLIGKVIDKIDKTKNGEPMSSLLDNITDLRSKTPEQKKENEEIAEKLANKYQELKDLGFTEDKIQNEMAKELDKLSTSRGIHLNEKDKNKLIGKVIDKIDETKNGEPMSSLLDNIPGLKAKTFQDKKQNDEMALALADKYQELQDLCLTEEEIQEEMSKEIDYQLADRGVSLNARDKNIFLEHAMHEEVLSWLAGLPGFRKNVERWFKGITELSEVTKNQTDYLANKLQKIKTSNVDTKTQQKQMQNEIGDWLDNVASKNNTQLKDVAKDNYINKLVKEVGDVGVNKIKIPKNILSVSKDKMTDRRSKPPGEFKSNITSSRSRSSGVFKGNSTSSVRPQSQFNDNLTSSQSGPGAFKGNKYICEVSITRFT